MPIEFTSEVQRASFYSPLEEFAHVDVDVEVREDPLTGRQSRIVPESFLTPDSYDIEEVVEDSEGCFFCPDSVGEVTPTYPDFVGVDRGREGEATSFPNLNPYGAHSNVVALTEDHYRPIDEFDPSTFADGIRLALRYVEAVRDHDETAAYASINMNFLRPAGSSLIHPHLQTLVDDRATNHQRRLLEASRAYHDAHGSAYWADLAERERDGERHVADTGSVRWLAPFAPKHHRHLVGVAAESGVPDPGGDLPGDLGTGLASVLDGYAAAGLNSFNVAIYLADDPAMPPVLDVVARSVFDEYYWSDSPFFTVLHDEGVVDLAPETYAAEAREAF
jgi:galactose-1-phosphate uridylyltransferase